MSDGGGAKGKKSRGDGQEKSGSSFDSLLRGIQDFTSQTWSKTAGQYPGNLLDLMMRTPDYMMQMGKSGRYLKDLREVAGLSVEELARTIKMDNPDTLKAIEEGRSPLNLDILYRLASFHARHDPLGFMLKFSREHAPLLWQILKLSGMDRLLISAEREVKFINIYRAHDKARNLSDEQFDKVIAFMDKAFDMALDLVDAPQPKPRKKKPDNSATDQS